MVNIWVGSMLMYMPMLFLVDVIFTYMEEIKGWKLTGVTIIVRMVIAAVVSVLVISGIDCMALCVR
ncbi:hypothetical protein Spock_5 [Bacillus phage Spock]|uniref:Uncharacterized protein n=2 Tax=Bequatrovirus spock TaxID=1918008 RepID=A0A1X9SFU0_9CAUD|nr:hypothetical protein Spock_5 [Bacillus phage Spock]AGY48405.1 hypothetical protein Spock_5 [Bacillus phage Spock]ARQ94919.1 hypothetical protein FLAPJACK_5 [Bacillus phage Flapjack]